MLAEDDPLVDGFDLSPNGRMVVYATGQISGRNTIYLSDFPVGRGRREVADDATRARFSADGTEIFFVKNGADGRGQPTRTLMSRSVVEKPAVTLGVARVLFSGESAARMAQWGYDVASDGRRFLTLKEAASAPGEGKRLVWMQNWPDAVKK